MTVPEFLPSKTNLQSRHGLDVLDTIDSLRSQGVGQYVDLPQIIVCGDQSSGKSSVLEALSGMAFPTKDALCTRFATELILRRSVDKRETTLAVSIIPGPNRSDVERKSLDEFRTEGEALGLSSIIQSATELMEGLDTESVFYADILRVEVSGPSQPHLTLVDLPGLFLAGNKAQSVTDAELVRCLVLSYMERPRSIILAVVSVKSEFTLQQVTRWAREVDPGGNRTLGLITKPDTLNESSEGERAYLELAQNRDVHFRLGWHVLRNRDFQGRNSTNAERDAVERAFFSTGAWKSLDPDQLGIDALRQRLSRVLQDQVLKHLPLVVEEIKSATSDCKAVLRKLGTARRTTADQRRYLLKVSQEFTSLAKAAIDGDYSNWEFFGDLGTDRGSKIRLRATVQRTLIEFAQSMRFRGHARKIVDDEDTSPEDASSEDTQTPRVSRSDYIKEVNTSIDRTRGCELPGTFNPLVVGEMFSAQCQPWQGLAMAAVHSAQAAKHERRLRAAMEKELVGATVGKSHKEQSAIPVSSFSRILASTEPDMESYASTMAIDVMEAYYKVALKRFVDEVSVHAVEMCLLKKLPSLLSLDVIFDLSESNVQRLAGESAHVIEERKRVTQKLSVLEDGLALLTQLSQGPTKALKH